MSFVIQQLTDPAVQMCAWLLIGTIAAELLVAIWAAVGPQHWFWRGLGLWAAVMVMVPIGAWQVMWVLVFAAGFIFAIVQLGRGVERYRLRKKAADGSSVETKYRRSFSLSDLLLFMFLICLWLPGLAAGARNSRGVNWAGLIAAAAVWAGLAVMATKLALGPRRVRAGILLAIGLPLGAYALTRTLKPVDFWWFVGESGEPMETAARLTIVGLELILVLAAVIGLVCAVRSTETSSRNRWIAVSTLAGLGSLAAVGLGSVYWELLQRPPRVVKFELAGNQFARIREIAFRVHAINRADETIAEIRRAGARIAVADELADLYAELLPMVALENAVLYDPEKDATPEYFGPTYQAMRGLSRSLQAEAEWARNKGQPDVAADYGLACVGVSESLGRGGIALDALVGRSIEGGGNAQLALVRRELSTTKLREVLAALGRDAERRESIEAIRARELDYCERAAGFPARLETTMLKITRRKAPWEASLEESNRRHVLTNGLLRAELAARLFTLEKGRRPASLEELVPEYLPEMPIDTYNGQPLRCKVDLDRLMIYSVGRDGVDDGGRVTDWKTYWGAAKGYDCDLESMTVR